MSETILKQLTASAANPMSDGVGEVVELFRSWFGDLKPADQVAVMAFISGGTILDILTGEVAGKEPSFTATAMIVATAQKIAVDGVASAFTASLNHVRKEKPKT